MHKNAVVGYFYKIPDNRKSHTRGWAVCWAENLGIEIGSCKESYDVAYLDHGANFSGGLNLFGGYTEDLEQNLKNFIACRKVYSLDRPCPDYGEILWKRKDVKKMVDKDFINAVSGQCKSAILLESTDLDLPWLCVGDSHAAAVSRKDSMVVKKDGTTLFGQMDENFKFIDDIIWKTKKAPKGITISLGNIDVRHHIIRLDADWKKMYASLFDYGKRLSDQLGAMVEYSLPWPIEHEDRKIPKTGHYQGKAFYGSRKERLDLVKEIWDFGDRENQHMVKYPWEWLSLPGEVFAANHMELTSSVHMSPLSYRRNNWGLDE